MANGEITHIRVVADLLDDVLVEVTGVALEGVANLEGVLHAREDVIGGGAEATLAQLQTLLLAIVVHVLDPGVVVGGGRIIDVVLELDDVGVGDGVGLDGAQDGRGTIVDGLDAELGGLSHSGHGEGDDAAHCDGKRSLLCFETEREGKAMVYLRLENRDKSNKQRLLLSSATTQRWDEKGGRVDGWMCWEEEDEDEEGMKEDDEFGWGSSVDKRLASGAVAASAISTQRSAGGRVTHPVPCQSAITRYRREGLSAAWRSRSSDAAVPRAMR